MLLRRGEAIFVVPAFVEGFEDVDELALGQSVEVRHHGVEFVDVVGLHVRVQRLIVTAKMAD